MTYAELYALVQDYLEVDETSFNANIPVFVKLAEEEIYRKVQLKDLRKNTTLVTVAATQYVDTPTDFLASYSMSVIDDSAHTFLIHKDVNFIREAYPNSSTTGVPRFYAEFEDDTFILGPTPDDIYSLELNYLFAPTSIVTSSTSWVGTNAQNALLYGTIYHGYIFLKGEADTIAHYKGKFDEALRDLTVLQEGRNNKDTYRKPNNRMNV